MESWILKIHDKHGSDMLVGFNNRPTLAECEAQCQAWHTDKKVWWTLLDPEYKEVDCGVYNADVDGG